MKLNFGFVMSGFLLVLAVIPRTTVAGETKTTSKTSSSSVDNSFKPSSFSKDSNSKPFKSGKVFISSKPVETSSSTTSEVKDTFVKKSSDSNQNRGRSGSGSGGRPRDYGVSSNYPKTAPASSSYGRK